GQGRLWKVRDGRVSLAARAPHLVWINDILTDQAGRLWVATSSDGLMRLDQPDQANPQFRRYGLEDGLSSLRLLSLADDRNGSIYIGTAVGVDRLDPQGGRVRHYTPADGLALGDVKSMYRDHAGTMWFGTSHGLTRMRVEDDRGITPAPVWITGISIAGQPRPLSGLGERNARQVEIRPGQEQLQFDFVGLSFAPGNVLRYEYRLGEEPWSQPIDARSVHY